MSYKHYFWGSSILIYRLHPLAIKFRMNTKKSQPDLFPPILLHQKTINRSYTEKIREGKRLAAWTCYLQPVYMNKKKKKQGWIDSHMLLLAGGRAKALQTNQSTNTPTNGWTRPLIELLCCAQRAKKSKGGKK